MIKVNNVLCTGCNVCVVSCPINFNRLKLQGYLNEENAVLLVKNGTAYSIYIENREANCDGCGVCVKECPQTAITMQIKEII
jgi:Pyruvate/2-oxoacid:ferredoxin oxidoreductase delta subunit